MLKKIERGQQFVWQHQDLFRCPICFSPMSEQPRGLKCQSNHQFDVSKKGTLYFLTHAIDSDYDAELFHARGRMIRSGMYQPVIDRIAKELADTRVLDVGCGEGSFLSLLTEQGTPSVSIGFDIAKEGVYQASSQPNGDFWCTADLTNLPFTNGAFEAVLNLFSPSNYQEFARILSPGGKVIKLIPNANYLKELRQAFYPDDLHKQTYSNERVLAKFFQEFPDASHERFSYVFTIPKERQRDLLEMSPLEWNATESKKEELYQHPLKKITIDLDLLIGTKGMK